MIRCLALVVLLSAPAVAETARVYSGEHEGFTRLVIELSGRADWTVGKSPIGYTFASTAETQPIFDLTEVWDRIPRTRLEDLRVDPEKGSLQLTLACQCHVLPFEYRTGVIVLDIKPGPAPAHSAFEQPFDSPSPLSITYPQPDEAVATYNWLDFARSTSPWVPKVSTLSLDTGGISLAPLRAKLLEEISRAATQSLIDMVLPGKSPRWEAVKSEELPWTQIRIGTADEFSGDRTDAADGGLTASGGACAPDHHFAVSDWGAGRLPREAIVEARTGLFGEFDAVDPAAVLNAVHLHLFLGFGAEAAQYANLLPKDDRPDEYESLLSMARVVDGDPDQQSPFLDMLTCDGSAVLWAVLAHTQLPHGQDVNTDAVVRGFLALPSHLRASLGPPLVEKMLDHDEPEAAQVIRNSVERTPDTLAKTVELLDVSAELHAGRPDTALDHAKAAMDKGGSGLDEMIALVEVHFQRAKPLPVEIATSLQAFLKEAGDPGTRADLLRALALSQVLSGQTDAGFSTAEQHGVEVSHLFQVTFLLAGDDAFLRHAVRPGNSEAIDVSPEVELDVAGRLLDLGFGDAALMWIDPVGPDDSADRRRVAAEAEFARGDARRAITLLVGLDEPEDESLRARALVQLGALGEARTAFLAAGLPDEAQRLTTWEGDWQKLRAEDAPLWSAAAAVLTPDLPQDVGPLARGAALLEDAATARVAMNALLSGLASPAY